MQDYHTVKAEILSTVRGGEAVILDVRSVMEHEEKHLAFPHEHEELDKISPEDFMLRRGLTKDDHVYLLCGSGNRAAKAAEKFVKAGYPNIHVVEGGLGACVEYGYPVQGYGTAGAAQGAAGKTPVSLERQVRIVAGTLIFAGALLGLTVHAGFTLLALFVGAGLVFAGVTNWCGMALLLAKAPWNKKTGSCSASSACAMPEKNQKSTGQSCQ
ncbi:MAG: DUF2892 domain-containing protein [Micavibrio sp.]|nr:MAG: DUF2892 domain-containing protein [Micavibrio sp.]